MSAFKKSLLALCLALWCSHPSSIAQTIAVKANRIHTAAGQPIENGVVVCTDGKISAIGAANAIAIAPNAVVVEAHTVLPGLIDIRTCVGLSGKLNVDHDSDQLESSYPLQPELRAIDAYNPHEELVEYIRSFGVTTVHTGHAPGELISGQTLIAKTAGNVVEAATIIEGRAVCATLAEASKKSGKQSPGTRGKQMAMLRTLLIEAAEYGKKREAAQADNAHSADKSETNEKPDGTPTNLRLEAMLQVLQGNRALLVTADRAQDIASALRLGQEFRIKIWLDSAAECHQLLPQIKQAGVPVILHPTMARNSGEKESLSLQTAKLLLQQGIPFAIQGGYEAYVPKVRVVLFEAAVAAAHGLPREAAIESITISAAKILGIDDRVGSIELGKDADLALYDGDPFEYSTHCTGVLIQGQQYPGEAGKH